MTAVAVSMALLCPGRADADSPASRPAYSLAVSLARSARPAWYARRLPMPHELSGPIQPVQLHASSLDLDLDRFSRSRPAASAEPAGLAAPAGLTEPAGLAAPAFVASVLEAPVTPSMNFGYRIIGGHGAVIVGVRGSF